VNGVVVPAGIYQIKITDGSISFWPDDTVDSTVNGGGPGLAWTAYFQATFTKQGVRTDDHVPFDIHYYATPAEAAAAAAGATRLITVEAPVTPNTPNLYLDIEDPNISDNRGSVGADLTQCVPIPAFRAPFIKVTSPNGGEQWLPGSTHQITWNSSGVDRVNIYLYKNYGGFPQYMTLLTVNGNTSVPAPASSGSFSWTIPAGITLGNDYKIGVLDSASTGNVMLYDLSDSSFSIVATSTACGNGVLDSGETCDDGGTENNDGCSASCQIESGWICSGSPSSCTKGR
jgi:cysteine-rich repeat protein